MAVTTSPSPASEAGSGRRGECALLLCPPAHFEIAYSINPWMDTAAPVDRQRAQRQWDALAETLAAAGARLEVLDPAPGRPDLVFTANAGLVDGRTFVPANMRHPERHGERLHTERWFADRGYEVRRLGPRVVHEGAGDAMPLAGTLVGGYRTRSTVSAYVELARLLSCDILPVQLVDPRLYHLDLVLCPLDDEHAIVAPSGLDDEGRRLIGELVPHRLELTEEEAHAFCANAVVVGRTVVMPACPPRVRRVLEGWGFEPAVADVSEFLKAGGGPRCLTLQLDVELSPVASQGAPAGEDPIRLAERHAARNYHPLRVAVARAQGAWVQDVDGRRYLDALSAYSALNFGHRHPRLVAAMRRQLDRVTLTSRAFHHDQLGGFCRELAALCGMERVLTMNTGAEAVETAIKVARKWGYERRGVRPGRAKIVVCHGNFHGRTTTIVSFSDDPAARDGFGPFTPGFEAVPFGDAAALEAAIDADTVAVLVEPIQGEAGVVVPPAGWLPAVRDACTRHGVLLMADEVQSGLGRTGRTFACEHEGVQPDVYVLGKALGGGLMPLSAVVAGEEVLGVLRPGDHGSTFGGNPLACAIGREVLAMLAPGDLQVHGARMGERLRARLEAVDLPGVREVRSRGLWLGLELEPGQPPARAVCDRLLTGGVLAKETHERTIRLSPPLIVAPGEVDFLADRVERALSAG